MPNTQDIHNTKRGGGRPDGRRQQLRNISVRSVRRDPPDVRKLGRAIIRLALAEAEAERAAQAAHTASASSEPAPVETATASDGVASAEARP
ncbi:hypothetical protein Namu_4630 [Nakamurella multipartita DSM 44233]|uniref:Uncharacterized protein n=1 Tax=Nakamurella multipartita (strain ATCC 700099 / DSM 44233 / CIP 104796 / JCM 9543 / NBRC 105858 / Y-104) TaxID=479431 RepID=C8X7Q6_NAKMY|nr:hypothetical protein Namu_4630 [Nakamurella multipartita DSM 44233]